MPEYIMKESQRESLAPCTAAAIDKVPMRMLLLWLIINERYIIGVN